MRRLIVVLFFVAFVQPASAQHNPYEYFLSGTSSQYIEGGELSPEASLFYAPVEGDVDIFTRLSQFNFSAVRYSRRGFDLPMSSVRLGDLELSPTDYRLMAAIRRMRIPRALGGGSALTVGSPGIMHGLESYHADASEVAEGQRVTLSSSGRSGLAGVRYSLSHRMSEKWWLTTDLSGRGGPDMHIEGIDGGDMSGSVLFTGKLNRVHSISFGVIGSIQQKDVRSSVTKEAIGLTGDNYYNPAWGYFNTASGQKKRSARTRREAVVMGFATYAAKVSGATTIGASVLYKSGSSSFRTPAWYDAATPFPDYYRYMPSYASDPAIANYLSERWRTGDPSASQVDWNLMYEVNRYAGQDPVEEGGARYLIEDRVEQTNDIQTVFAGSTRWDDRSSASYGLRFAIDRMNGFKRVDDLLGAAPFLNVDQYLADTVRYGGQWLNDLRNPSRVVDEGDRYGYDYDIITRKTQVYGTYNYAADRVQISAAAELGRAAIFRKGNYEKHLHPGAASYGKSKNMNFDIYGAKVTAGYSFSPRHIVRITGMAADMAPEHGNVFISPEQANLTIETPRAISVLSGEAEYMARLNGVMLEVAGFWSATSRETAVYSYYDDIAAVYSDMVLSDISKCFYGVEIGVRIDLSTRLSLNMAGAVGDYAYTSDPEVDIYNDALLERYVTGSKSYLRGYRIGNTPQRVATAELRYDMFGFTASLTFNYMADRHVAANPMRRMERAYNLATSPERYMQFVAQEKLPDASTVDLFAMKYFAMRRGSIAVMASVSNLLNNTDIAYSGYEQMRIMRRGYDLQRQYVPFDSKYLYSYPRTFYLSATYSF